MVWTVSLMEYEIAGLYVVVGFPESIKLFNLLVDDLQLWREFPIIKNCVICAFSTGGQYFAAVNGNNVHIFSTYNGLNVGTLRAHINQVGKLAYKTNISERKKPGSRLVYAMK
jgi:hypothetical protein